MSWRGYMTGTYGCKRADAAANYRMQHNGGVGVSNRVAANRQLGGSWNTSSNSCPKGGTVSHDRGMWRDLKVAADSGQGITKPELKTIVAAHQRGGALSASKQNALNKAVQGAMFARQATGKLAGKIGAGADLSLIDIRVD